MSGPKITNGVLVYGFRSPEEVAADKELYDRNYAIYTERFAKMTDEEVRSSDAGFGPEGIWQDPAYAKAREEAFRIRDIPLP
ncbi:MAG: hypothetical protein Q8R35_02180 [bacterium]|nr:hypothetical protein [bacterium]